MARRPFRDSDPTANTAIRNADRSRRTAATLTPATARPKRKLAVEFPDAFAGLLLHEAREIAMRAWHLAGEDVNAIEEHHLIQARKEAGR